jgi:hypothetical protein
MELCKFLSCPFAMSAGIQRASHKRKNLKERTRAAAFDNQLERVNFAWVDGAKCAPLFFSTLAVNYSRGREGKDSFPH